MPRRRKNTQQSQENREEKTPIAGHLEPTADNETRFRNFIENLPVMFYAVEAAPPYAPFYVSPAFASLGYPLEEWRANPDMWLRVLHPADSARVVAEIDRAMRAGEETDCEYRILKKDGEARWVRDRGCFVRGADGEIVCWQGIILDITERKRAVEALRDSEERYRALFENANDLIYVHDLEGNYLAVNSAAARAFGYSREEALALNVKEVIAPEHLALAQAMLAEKIAAGARQTAYEIDCINKSGRRLTLEVNTTLISKNGAPIAIQGIARDVTERKRTEDALRESEERYRDLFENANDLIYTHDLEGNFTSLNRAGELITGYKREEVVDTGFNLSRVVAPADLEGAQEMIRRKLEGEGPTTYELDIVAKNGQHVSLELSTRLIYHRGRPVGVQGIGRDITERKRTEDALKESERRYRFLGEGIMHQVWTAQPDGRLDYVNERAAQYFGRPAARLVGESWQDVIHPHDLAECLRRWRRSLETGDYYEVEFRLLRRDGEFRWHLARAKPGYDADGRIVKWFGTNTDIHEQKAAEAKLNHFAKHDPLTNLANRAEFMCRLRASSREAERDRAFRFAVLFLDLDRFKRINDSLGHAVGDKLLVAIAERLEECVRPQDTVARLGGDEFTVLLNGIAGERDALQIAERIQQVLGKPFLIDNYETFPSASITPFSAIIRWPPKTTSCVDSVTPEPA